MTRTLIIEVALGVGWALEVCATLYYRRRSRSAEESLLRWAKEIVRRP